VTEPGDGLDQFRLAVPFDASDAEDLTGSDVETHPSHGVLPASGCHREVLDAQDSVTGDS
jgi:hypothetical protein